LRASANNLGEGEKAFAWFGLGLGGNGITSDNAADCGDSENDRHHYGDAKETKEDCFHKLVKS
jgi:hypothetical protein